MQRQVDKKKEGNPLFEGVDMATLTEWKRFMDSPLYAFLIQHIHRKIIELGQSVLSDKGCRTDLNEVAYRQGQRDGLIFFKVFFDNVSREWERRHQRVADESANTVKS